MKITIRQLHAVLREMGLFNMAESAIEKNETDFALWKKPATEIDRTDDIVKRWQQNLALSDAAIDDFFNRASQKSGGPIEKQDNNETQMIDENNDPQWLTLAKSYIGIKEIPGEKSNPAIDLFFRDAGFPNIQDDDISWCAAFVGAILKRAGYPRLNSLTARDYLKYGIKLDKPRVGCIAVLWRESRSSWKGHVGFVCSINWEDKTFKLLGGNQSNEVNIKTESFDKVLSWRFPVKATIPALKAAGSSEAKLSDIGKNASLITAILGAVGTTLQHNPELAKSLMPDMEAVKAIALKVDELVTTIAQYKYGWLLCLGSFFYLLMKQWQTSRLERAERGYPILKQDNASV